MQEIVEDKQEVTICQCDGGVATIYGSNCLPKQGSLEEVAKRYSKDDEFDVGFVELVDITIPMLALLVNLPFI